MNIEVMDIEKLDNIISTMDPEEISLIKSVINNVLKEIIYDEDFLDNNPDANIPTEVMLQDIENDIDEYASNTIMHYVIEFCITNDYMIDNQAWNCTLTLIDKYRDSFSAQEIDYLKVLQQSYVSLYKVIKAKKGESIALQDAVESNKEQVIIYDEILSNNVDTGQYLVARILQDDHKSILSLPPLIFPTEIVEQFTKQLTVIMDLMSNPMFRQMMSPDEISDDEEHNKLLMKKMWIKDILQAWYAYYRKPSDNSTLGTDQDKLSSSIVH